MKNGEELSVIDALAPFDTTEQKHFQRPEILEAICSVSKEQWNSEATQYEYLAFSMVADAGKDCWGTYYGPFAKYRRTDKAELRMPYDSRLALGVVCGHRV